MFFEIKNNRMGKVKNLVNAEAVRKIKELAKDADMCLFTTALTKLPLSARPMSTQEIDDEGNLWFFSGKTSDKNSDITIDNRVQLFYANKGASEYMSIYGEAKILYDRKKIDELWGPMLKTWFNGGKDDPELTLIKVRQLDAYYWDTKNNSVVALLKMVVGAVTGKELDDSLEGKMNV